MANLSDLRIAVIATDGFEESELTEPVRALHEKKAFVEIISPREKTIQALRHMEPGAFVAVDRMLGEVLPENYDALLLPGGAINADSLRLLPDVQAFVRAMEEAGRPIAAICHAPWILVSAGLVRDRTLTSYHTIQDDIRNAGGNWVDREVVVDRNWVTSRQPSDLPAFIASMENLFTQTPKLATAGK
jgi:protease I